MSDAKPPLLPSWRAWYIVVLSFLAILIALFYTFRLAFE